MTLEEFKNRLSGAMERDNVKVTHILAAQNVPCPVLCWQEIGINHFFGDEEVVASVACGQLDLFTETEYDQTHKKVTAFLISAGCPFTYEGTSYDNERGEWRYIWTFYLFGG